MDRYKKETSLLNFSHPSIAGLVEQNGWGVMGDREKIQEIYLYVRDKIAFGYNRDDALPAAEVVTEGYGQCNTKAIVFMALLRAVGIPCRIHGFAIDKKLQKGAMKGFTYRLAPREILHSWVEIFHNGHWLNMEGVILDKAYLSQLQTKFSNCSGTFCGYGVATDNFQHPQIDWEENDTYIQKEGIVRDFGVFDSPDELFAQHRQPIGFVKRLLFEKLVCHLMNRNIRAIRANTRS